jgi:hypothetical protein
VFGVITGIPMEFQFGTNWARFSTVAGGVIGQTLAMEGMFAFFLESSFLGLFLFGAFGACDDGWWFNVAAACTLTVTVDQAVVSGRLVGPVIDIRHDLAKVLKAHVHQTPKHTGPPPGPQPKILSASQARAISPSPASSAF